MHTLIGENGKVGYGCLDGPVHFNHEAFPLRTFFGRRAGGLRRRMALGAFSYLGILGDGCLAGLAAVRLGYVANVFGFFFDFRTGDFWEHSVKDLPGSLDFPLDSQAMSGDYVITAELGPTVSTRTVNVKPYTLPRFKVDFAPDKPYYLPGETATGSVTAHYFFGKPVAGAEVILRSAGDRFARVAVVRPAHL
ncbi:MAG: hypothetical protein HGA66_07480, partial [Holophaga sp.]|nr:hypothetical protein [Holophaga sp.]